MGVVGWPEVFRGSEAIAAGLVTPGMLRGRRFVRIFPDIYAPAGDEPPDLELRSRAAGLLVARRGVVSGYSAAELLGASCAPLGAPAEVTLLHGRQRAHPGLLVHRRTVVFRSRVSAPDVTGAPAVGGRLGDGPGPHGL
jgi:hypothetical protein